MILTHRLGRSEGAREPATPVRLEPRQVYSPNDSRSGGTSRPRLRGVKRGSSGLSGKAPSTTHTAAWARGAKRTASLTAPPPARRLPSSPLRAPAPGRPPARPRARGPAFPVARPQPPPARPGGGDPVAPLIWPQHRLALPPQPA